jgi:hypothetical protein
METKAMFNLFSISNQVKVEAVDRSGNKTTFWRPLKPRGESTFAAVENELKETGKNYTRISVYYP